MKENSNKKAILVVSFGTTHPETRAKTIDVIEQTLQEAFPEQRLYRAWTSRMVIRKLMDRDGYAVDTVEQAMERMLADGIRQVLVQPTHVMDGIENERMKEAVSVSAGKFEQVRFGAPLLSEDSDFRQAAEGILQEFAGLSSDTALVLVGHGTKHAANTVYERLERQFRNMGESRVFVGTVEDGTETSVWKERKKQFRKVILAPFLIVAGEHAKQDLAGDCPDSWKSRLEAAGMKVECSMKGLGEYAAIRSLFAAHAEKAMEE